MLRNSLAVPAALCAMLIAPRVDAQAAKATTRGRLDPAAKAIFDRYKGHLGSGPAPKFQHIIVEMTMLPGAPTSRIETFFQLPDKIFSVTTIPGMGTTETGYDGKVGWSNSPITGPVLLDSTPLKLLKASMKSPNGQPADDFVGLTLLGRETIDGRAVDALLCVSAEADTAIAYFDVLSGLLSGMRTLRAMGQPADTAILFLFGNYKRMAGQVMPTKMTARLKGYEMVNRTVHVDHDPIDPTKFMPPAAVLALLPKRP